MSDWINVEDNETTSKSSPSFFDTADTKETKDVENQYKVPAEEQQEFCSLCGEKFEQFWDESQEEWMYKGAIKIPDREEIVHYKCYSDSQNNIKTDSAVSTPDDKEPVKESSFIKEENKDNDERKSKRVNIE